MKETMKRIQEYLQEEATATTQVKALRLILTDPEGTVRKVKEIGLEYLTAETEGMSIENLKEAYPPMDEIEARNLYMQLTEEQKMMIPYEDRENLDEEVEYYIQMQEEKMEERERDRLWDLMSEEEKDEQMRLMDEGISK